MTVYKDVNLINFLINRYPSDYGIYIHIDKKSDIQIKDITSKAIVIKKRKVYWGSINHLKAVLDLLKMAIKENKYDYYHIITGQDINVASPENFDNIIGNKNNIYINIFPIPNQNWTVWGYGYDIYRKISLCKFCDIRDSKLGWIDMWLRRLQNHTKFLQPLPKYPLFGGSLYCSLTKDAVNEVFTNPLSKILLKKLEFSLCGEEIFFQTVLMNSKLKDKIINNHLRYIDWNKGNPAVLDMSDYESIRKGKYLFCRKVTTEQSFELIKML